MQIIRISSILAATLLITSCTDTSPSVPDTMPDDSAQSQVVLLEPITINGLTISGSLGAESIIEFGTSIDPVTDLVVADQFVGSGNPVVQTSTVLAHYVGYGLITGQKFDSSWLGGGPIPFGLNQVIAGWTQGIPGMKIGGRRVLIIPAELAYGAKPPAGSGIEPNEPLVFVVDMYDFK